MLAVMTFSMVALPSASALTQAEATAIITALGLTGAQAASIQALVTGGGTGGSSSYTFNTNLTVGSKGADVTALQNILVSGGFLHMPAGVAMGYFGNLTKTAVAAWQASAGISPAAGYVGPKSRAALNAMGGGSTPPPGCTVNCTPPPPATGNLSVSIASDTPAGASHAYGTAYNPVLKLNLMAGSTAATFNGVTVTRSGFASDSDISGVAAFDAAGNRLTTNFVTFADSKAVLTFTTPLTVAANTTTPIWIKTNISATATGSTYMVSVKTAADVSASGTVAGTFPMTSPEFALVSGSGSVGGVTVDAVSVYANGNNDATLVNVNIGTMNQQIAKFRFVANGNEDVWMKHVALYNAGNTNDSDIANIDLVAPDGTILGTAQMMNRWVNFDLTSNGTTQGYKLLKGTTRDFSVQFDVISGSTRNVRFVIQNDYDVQLVGAATGSGILETKAGTVDNAFPIGDVSGGNTSCTTSIPCINKITIAAGTALFAKSTDAPSGNIAAGGSSVVLGKWDFTPQGEAMELRQFTYNVNSVASLSGTLRLKVNGSTVYSVTATSAATTATAVTLSSYPTLAAGVKATITVESDISSSATTGATVAATLDVTQVRRISSNDIVDPSVASTAGNTLTINTASLAAAKNSSYPDSTIVAGLNSAKVASFNLSSGATENVAVSSLTFSVSNTTGVSNLMLCDHDLGCTTGQIGSTITTPASTGNVVTMTGFAIPSGANKTIDVYLTTNSSATGTEVITLTAVSATGQSSSVTVSATGLSATGQTITFSTGGTLTLALDTTNTPVLGVAHSGEVDRTLLAARFTANNAEDIKVTTVQLNLTNGQASLQNLKLFVNGQQVGTATSVTGGSVASFTNTNGLFTVTKDNTVTMYVKGSTTNTAAINSQGIANVSIDYVQALGASGGSTIKPGTTLMTTWSATSTTVTGASITVSDTTGFHAGDVVFAYDGTNGGALGIVTAEPTSTTAMTVATTSAITYAGSATISKIGSGASSPASAGGGAVGTAIATTVTTTKGFNVYDPVISVGATATRLGYVSAVTNATTMSIVSNGATTGTTSYVAKLGTDTGIYTTTTANLTTTATATTVGSTSGFNVGDFVVAVDTAAAGTTCIVTAIGSSTSMSLQCKAAVTATSITLVRVGQSNPSTTLVTTAASAGTRAVATAAATVTDTTGFGVGDVIVSAGSTTTGSDLGKITANTNSTTMSATGSAAAGTFARITRLPGAAAAGATVTFQDVEPTITADASVVGGAQTGTTGQVVGMFNVKADGDRPMNITSLNIQANGNNLPWNYVTAYDLYNGSTLLSSATALNFSTTSTGTNALTGTTIKFCGTTADVGSAGEIDATGMTAANLSSQVSVNDTIVLFKDTSNYITAKVTAKAVTTGTCGGTDATDTVLTVSNSTTTGTAPTSGTITKIKSFNVYFNSNSSTPLATQTITAGSTLPLTIKADTTSVRTGLASGVSASFNVKVNGTQGASNGGLTWGYTPSGGSAITSLTTSDSYPVNGPTFSY